MKKLFLAFAVIGTLVSCSNEIENGKKDEIPSSDTDENIEIINTPEEVDLSNMQEVRTMSFSKKDFNTSMKAYFDNDVPYMFKEEYKNNDLYYAVRTYFFENGALTRVSDYQEKMIDSSLLATEVEYYYEKEQLTKTTKKESTLEKTIDEVSPVEFQPENIPDFSAYLQDLLAQKGRFQLQFVDIKEYGNEGTFIRAMLGAPLEWESYFKVEKEDAFITELLKNKSKYEGKPIEIQFAYGLAQNGAEYMYYENGSFVNE